ncbi:hypothetical protein ACFLTD_04490, partial [Elusimicrobiota bacterium]
AEAVSGTLHFDLEFLLQDLPDEMIKESASYSLLDAKKRGVFNIGSARGSVNTTYDEELQQKVLRFNYSAPQKSAVGVWTQDFPEKLDPSTANTARINLKPDDISQLDNLSAKIEIKGTMGIQEIPVDLASGWNSSEKTIDWDMIGNINEAVLVISPNDGYDNISGTLYFNLDFINLEHIIEPLNHTSLYGLLDAAERGIFSKGSAKGNTAPTFDETIGRKVLKFEYLLPESTLVGLWTKDFPDKLGEDFSDAVNIGVMLPESGQEDDILIKLEIKGINAKQDISMELKPGWNHLRVPICWKKIGDLNEVVYVVSPRGLGKSTSGTLYFDLEFDKLTLMEKLPGKIILLLGISCIFSLFSFLILKAAGKNKPVTDSIKFDRSALACDQPSFISIFKRDILYGITALFITLTAVAIYSLGKSMGTLSPAETIWNFLSIGLAGAIIAWLLKFAITRKHLTTAEIFQNIFLTGFLAVTSSNQVLLQAPATWTQVLMKSNLTALIVFLIYHISNAGSLASKGKHLKPVPSILIAGTPYLFGWLLLLENSVLLKNLTDSFTIGLFSAWPLILELGGRLFTVFIFNEALINGISLATSGRILKTPKAHIFTFFVSLGVVFSPYIANIGSSGSVASLPVFLMSLSALITTILSHAGLWGEVYLITGITLDSTHGNAPTFESISSHVMTGMKKGMAYSGILISILYILNMLLSAKLSQSLITSIPVITGILSGAVLFPLIKTIIETFDGSQPFFERMRYSYRNPVLYARGAVAGFGITYMITHELFQYQMSDRIEFGLLIGILASAGISLLRDATYSYYSRGRIQSWRLYFIDALLGAFIGGATAFYLDSSQVPVIIEKFRLYISAGLPVKEYTTYPLINKWGRIDLGTYTGGVKLLYTEALAGVINWSVAAWLFAINRAFMEAIFQRDKAPVKFLFSRDGAIELVKHMIQVLRWGLWMSPIIFTFLRMMPNPTWYNQDGAVRTLFAAYNNIAMSPETFQAWSLKLFVWLLASDLFRIIIWIDHMGLRVATLVNLSFIGMNKLDEKMARFIGTAAAQRYIPEAVKRFTTWGPLLLPFYLPRGEAWDYAWTTSEAMQNAAKSTGISTWIYSLSVSDKFLYSLLAIIIFTMISFAFRALKRRSDKKREKTFELGNREYRVTLKENGGGFSQLLHKEYDLTRRSYDTIDPCGRVLYIVDAAQKPESSKRYWPIKGNFPIDRYNPSCIERTDRSLLITNTSHGISSKVDISLPDMDTAAEIWTLTLENLTDTERDLKISPYMEWVLNRPMDDRFHPQYSKLFPVMEYSAQVNAVMAWQKNTQSMGIIASEEVPEGFHTSRMDFIGRARSIWTPRVLETLDFLDPVDTDSYPTFDPIGSLLVGIKLEPGSSKSVRFIIGYAKDRTSAVELINKHMDLKQGSSNTSVEKQSRSPLIGHGEILPGTPVPYHKYTENGNKIIFHTPYTPRAWDHAMSNAFGHSVLVTNRGLHTSCNGNSQQNRITPDAPDTVTREVPGEAIYLYDPDKKQWYCPTHHPLNDYSAVNTCEFGVDGTAVFRSESSDISTELTVFVPTKEPVGLYLLTIKNHDNKSRKIR